MQRCVNPVLIKREEIKQEELYDSGATGGSDDERNGHSEQDENVNYNEAEVPASRASQRIRFIEQEDQGNEQDRVASDRDSNAQQAHSSSLYSSLTPQGQYWRSDHLDLFLDLLNLHTRSLRMLLGLRDGLFAELSRWQSSLREREDRVRGREIQASTAQNMEVWQSQLSNREMEFFSAQDSFQTNCARQIKEMLRDISEWDEKISKHFTSPRSPRTERILPRSISPRSPRSSPNEKNYRRRSDSPISQNSTRNNRRSRRRDSPHPTSSTRSTRNRRRYRSPASP